MSSMTTATHRKKYRIFSCAVVIALGNLHAAEPAKGEWVRPGPDGKLIYKTTPRGDRILDFSSAGYMGGGVSLPAVPERRTVRPSGGEDDTAIIQKAIDEVSALKLENGFRGAVVLVPGTFNCSDSLRLSASGVVLRGSSGEKPGEPTATIRMAGKPHTAIMIRTGNAQGSEGEPSASERGKLPSAETKISDPYVPSGSKIFAVENAAGFAIGDTIEIRRPVTEAWIKFMQMDDLVRDGRPQTWLRAGNRTAMTRRIVAVAESKVTVDLPLSDSFDSKYLNPPGTTVVEVRPPSGLSQVGIENLRIQCPPQEINHTEPHFSAVRMNGQDCWMRDVVCEETMNSIGVNGRRITLQRVAVNRKARHQGSSKPAEFSPNASQLLLDRCSGSGDNIWYAATGSGQTGPIVMLNCTFHGNGRVESHQRWSTGMLYDNLRVPEGGIDFRNRGSMGSGHGWSMGWGVAWNCEAKDYVIQSPPGATNWMIGCIGESKAMPRPFGSEPPLAEGTKDSPGNHVTPQSLYLTQLAERLGRKR
jgi:hypothetical protein